MSCFSPQADTKQPRVRLSDQYQYSAGSTGCSKPWTGSSVCVFPLDMTSVQLPAGKTKHNQTAQTHTKGERDGCVQNGMHANCQSMTWTDFGWLLLSAAWRHNTDRWGELLTGKSITCDLSAFLSSYNSVNALCPTPGSTQSWHPPITLRYFCKNLFHSRQNVPNVRSGDLTSKHTENSQ